jgi:hypothetical protein
VGWIVHRIPSHFSASGTAVPLLLVPDPTAKQLPAVGQDTALKPLLPPGSAGTAWSVHLVPSHRSANGVPAPELESNPTAVQASGAAQDTPLRLLLPGGAGITI